MTMTDTELDRLRNRVKMLEDINGVLKTANDNLALKASRSTLLELAVTQIVKRTPFTATKTGIMLEVPFVTIKQLQDALKAPVPCEECGCVIPNQHFARCSKGP
jgi:hypothetical protein